MYTFHVVGAGSLGSGFVIEAARRASALKFPLKIVVHDFDEVEERNVFSQEFLPSDIGSFKAEAIAQRASLYNHVECEARVHKIERETLLSQLPVAGDTVVVDAVDNVPTRHLLWEYGMVHSVPVMHLGMSTDGDGVIGWNCGLDLDNFNLSPALLSPAALQRLEERGEERKLPPCELNSFRSLILNTVLAGVNAAFLFLGKDATRELVDEDGSLLEVRGLATVWHTTPKSMIQNDALLQVVEW